MPSLQRSNQNYLLFSDKPLTIEQLQNLDLKVTDVKNKIVKDIKYGLHQLWTNYPAANEEQAKDFLDVISARSIYGTELSKRIGSTLDSIATDIGNLAKALNLNMNDKESIYIIATLLIRKLEEKGKNAEIYIPVLKAKLNSFITANLPDPETSKFYTAMDLAIEITEIDYTRLQSNNKKDYLSKFAKRDGVMDAETFIEYTTKKLGERQKRSEKRMENDF